MDRWLNFGGITILTNEPTSGIEPHFTRINGELLQIEKGEKGKMNNYVVDSRITCTGQKTKKYCAHLKKFFFN